MSRNYFTRCAGFLSLLLTLMVTLTTVFGKAPKELQDLKVRFEKKPSHTEADRQEYIVKLAKLRDKFAAARKTADWRAVDAEIRNHPESKDADSKALSALLVGKWKSPRHEYAFKKDGTWTMLPEKPGITHGKWRIEGNQYFDTELVEPLETTQYTIILLTKKYFIFADKEDVFYETRE
jgi:hypothetical protein